MNPAATGTGWHMGARSFLRAFKTRIRRYFWLWIAYQTMKGIATTTIIWAPLIYACWTE